MWMMGTSMPDQFYIELMGVVVALLTIVGGTVRFLLGRIDRVHSRIDSMKHDFVHKDNLAPLTQRMDEIVTETRRTNSRLDDLMKFMMKSAPGHE